jgi:hypothetical protein
MCAEVLVPTAVRPNFIEGAYAASEVATIKAREAVPGLAVEINPRLFFQ